MSVPSRKVLAWIRLNELVPDHDLIWRTANTKSIEDYMTIFMEEMQYYADTDDDAILPQQQFEGYGDSRYLPDFADYHRYTCSNFSHTICIVLSTILL